MSTHTTHRQRTTLLIGLGLVAMLLFALAPDSVYAASPINDLLDDKTSALYKGWQFFRSLINYSIVGGLLLIAFANVLRISIDTYAVKKVLPTLVVAFILANFSLLVSQVFLDVASSLALTSNSLAQGFSFTGEGSTPFQDAQGVLTILMKQMLAALDTKAAISGGVASSLGGLAIFSTLGGGGIGLIGILVILILIPVVLLGGLWLLFSVRFYVLQLAIVLAPVFLIGMAFPFTRSYFQKWFSIFMIWTFMRPVSALILGVGAAAISFGSFAGTLGGLVTFAIVVGAMAAALYIPFQMGAAVAGAVKALGSFALGTGRLGLAGMLGGVANMTGGGKISQGFRFAQGLTRLPEAFMAARERKNAQIKTAADSEAAGILGQNLQADAGARALIAEKAKETAGKGAMEKLHSVLEFNKMNDYSGSAGALGNVFSEGDRSNYYMAVESMLKTLEGKKAEEFVQTLLGRNKKNAKLLGEIFMKDGNKYVLKDTTTAKELLAHANSGAIWNAQEIKNADGTTTTRWVHAKDRHSKLVAAMGLEWNKANKAKEFWDQSGTLGQDANGNTYLLSEEEMATYAAHNIGDADPQMVTKGQNRSSLVRTERGISSMTGKVEETFVMDEGMIKALAIGKFGAGQIGEIGRFSQEGKTGLNDIFGDKGEGLARVEQRLREEIERLQTTGKISAAQARDRRREGYATLAALSQYNATGANRFAAAAAMNVLGDETLDPQSVQDIISRIKPMAGGGGGAERTL